MNIKIDDTYSLKSDARNVMLVESKIVQDGDNKGETYESTIGYYGTVEGALNDYERLNTNLSKATTFQELRNDIKEIKKTIRKISQQLGGENE